MDEIGAAEVANEHKEFGKKQNIANTVQKPKAELIAEGTKAIDEHANKGKVLSAPASSSGSSKWGKAVAQVATTPKAAPAVVRTIVKAPQGRPPQPNRPTPPIDSPAKRQKPAVALIPYDQKAGRGKGSKSRPGSIDDGNQGWHDDGRYRGHQLPHGPPPYSGKGRKGSRDALREYQPRASEFKDVRETDRLNREHKQAAANRERERERTEATNSDAYNQWFAMAWQPVAPSARASYEEGQSYFSHADNRSYEQRDHSRGEETAVVVHGAHQFLPSKGGRVEIVPDPRTLVAHFLRGGNAIARAEGNTELVIVNIMMTRSLGT